MDENKKLVMIFRNSAGKNVTISIDDPKDDLTEEQWETRMHQAMDLIYEKARALGGHVSGEHGIGWAKKPYLKDSVPEENLELMRGIKRAFDPNWILNPGKIF